VGKQRNGRHEETRTPDLYRVNLAVLGLQRLTTAWRLPKHTQAAQNTVLCGSDCGSRIRPAECQDRPCPKHITPTLFLPDIDIRDRTNWRREASDRFLLIPLGVSLRTSASSNIVASRRVRSGLIV
jgi:hypothetical protein